MAQESARGTLVLFAGNIVYAGISTVAALLVARLLGPDGYGSYSLALVVPSILYLFAGFGVNFSVTRYVAFYVSSGDLARAKSVTRTASTFLLLCGLALSLVNYFGAGYLVDSLLHRPELIPYVQIASLLVVGQTLTQCASSTLIGWSSMREQSLFNVLQSGLKLALSAGLILAGFGVYGAIVGHVLSYAVEGGLAVLTLYLAHMRPWSGNGSFTKDAGLMLRYGFPLFAGSIVAGLASQYVTIVLASIATNAVIGYYQAALNVTIAVSLLSTALANVLFRSFAALDGVAANTSLAFSYAVKYVSFMLTPVVFLLAAGAGPLFDVLYGPSYGEGVLLLKLVALAYIPVAFGLTVLPSFLNGIGKSRITMIVTTVDAIALAFTGYFFSVTLGLGAKGVMLAFLVANTTSTSLGLLIAGSNLRVRLSFGPLTGIIAAALVSWLVVSMLPMGWAPSVLALAVDLMVFASVYLTCVPLMRGVNADDLVRIGVAGETLGPLRGVLTAILGYEGYILSLVKRVSR